MEEKKRKMLILIIPIIIGIMVSSVIQGYVNKENQIRIENNTRFYVVNKTSISVEKPVDIQKNLSFRIIIQNHENKRMVYILKIIFDKKIIYDKDIKVGKDKIYNKTLSLNLFNFTNNSDTKNRYGKLEFRLYDKDNKLYGVNILQFSYRNKKIEKTIDIKSNQTNSTILY